MRLDLRVFSLTITIGSFPVYRPALAYPGYFRRAS